MPNIKKVFNQIFIITIYVKAIWFLSPREPIASNTFTPCAANIPFAREEISLKQKCSWVWNGSNGEHFGPHGSTAEGRGDFWGQVPY